MLRATGHARMINSVRVDCRQSCWLDNAVYCAQSNRHGDVASFKSICVRVLVETVNHLLVMLLICKTLRLALTGDARLEFLRKCVSALSARASRLSTYKGSLCEARKNVMKLIEQFMMRRTTQYNKTLRGTIKQNVLQYDIGH